MDVDQTILDARITKELYIVKRLMLRNGLEHHKRYQGAIDHIGKAIKSINDNSKSIWDV